MVCIIVLCKDTGKELQLASPKLRRIYFDKKTDLPFSEISFRTPLAISSCRLFLTEIFLSKAEKGKKIDQ